MAVPPYPYSPIRGRPTIEWPDGKKMAFYIGLNIEHFLPGLPSTSISSLGLSIDPMNHSWRDYGTRVGIWRMIELLDALDLPATAIINSDVCHQYPQILEAGVERGWAWVAHGVTNSHFWNGFDEAEEGFLLDKISNELRAATGQAPRGWLGPAFTETENTSRLLADRGFTYTLNWAADDQPFPLQLSGPRMMALPYSAEINDITAFLLARWTPEQFASAIIDQFDRLRSEAQRGTAVVMPLCLHPFLSNVPFRHVHLERVLKYIRGHDDVWFATSDDIAGHYMTHYFDAAVAHQARRSKPVGEEGNRE